MRLDIHSISVSPFTRFRKWRRLLLFVFSLFIPTFAAFPNSARRLNRLDRFQGSAYDHTRDGSLRMYGYNDRNEPIKAHNYWTDFTPVAEIDSAGNPTRSYMWGLDLSGTLDQAGAPAGSARRLEFKYDWRGRRIYKKETDLGKSQVVAERIYVYDGWNLYAELTPSGTLVQTYIWGHDLSGTRQGAGGVGGLVGVKPAGGPVHFAPYDGNGNVAGLVDGSTGQTSAWYEYGPFGEPIRVSGPMGESNPIRFSTKFTDDISQLVYYGYRYYNPGTGRWLSRDPIGEQESKNLYGFVCGSPVNGVDVNGLWHWYNPYSWMYDPDDDVKHPALPLPDSETRYSYGRMRDELLDDAGVRDALAVCAAVKDAAETAIEISPQNQISEMFGHNLLDKPVSGREQMFAIGSVVLGPAAKTCKLAKCKAWVMKLPKQLHHWATDKSSKWTKPLERIAGKYNLALDEPWNKELLPQRGRHPTSTISSC